MLSLTTLRGWPKIAVYDCEAERWTNVVLVCHVDEMGNRVSFHKIEKYIDWLFSDRFDGTHVWAHWGGHYDHRFLISEAIRRKWSFETIMSGGSMILLTIHKTGGKSLNFCDSSRIMPDALAKIGKAINLPKLDADRGHIENMPMDEMLKYCFRDCDIVLQGLLAMKQALAEVGGDFAYTLASMASRWVRRSDVLDWKRFTEEINGSREVSAEMLAADEFCLPAYFGGRCEVFRKGIYKGPLYYYDVRSSYPWSMLGELPAYFRGFGPPSKNTHRALSKSGISEATVTVAGDTYLPVLPVRHAGKLVFPVGRFRGRWCNDELLAAYERGAKVELHAQANFEPRPFLKPFVDNFYALRRVAIGANDDFRAYAYKILLNSCYGKLIETVERRAITFGRDLVERDLEAGKDVFPTAIAGVYEVRSESQGPFRHVAAGAQVTARSRLLLHRRMEECAKRGRIFYCDTDSIVTDVELPTEPDELGNLKLEAVIEEAEILAPKVYRLTMAGGKTIFRCKGIPVRADSAAESEKKFRAYVDARRHPEKSLAARGAHKEGVSGFLSDVRSGNIDMQKVVLYRGLRREDSKRRHGEQGDSLPLEL